MAAPSDNTTTLEGSKTTATAPETYIHDNKFVISTPTLLQDISPPILANSSWFPFLDNEPDTLLTDPTIVTMTNPWHNPNKRKKKHKSLTTIIADSGTNINLLKSDIPLSNERPSTLQVIAASKDGIQAISKGEFTLGTDTTQLTGHRADVNESLAALGDYAKDDYVTILDKPNGIRITKASDVEIKYKVPPLSKAPLMKTGFGVYPSRKEPTVRSLKQIPQTVLHTMPTPRNQRKI